MSTGFTTYVQIKVYIYNLMNLTCANVIMKESREYKDSGHELVGVVNVGVVTN